MSSPGFELPPTQLPEGRGRPDVPSGPGRRIAVLVVAIAAVVGAGIGLFFGLRSNDRGVISSSAPSTPSSARSGPSSSTSSTTSSTPRTTTTRQASRAPAVLEGPGDGKAITGATPCPASDGSSPRTTSFSSAPPMCIDASAPYAARIVTSKGAFTVMLDATRAPLTVNNFVVLARYHFFDGIAFHRIIANFMIQGGDPSNPPDGQGNPGYEFADELPTDPYEVGSIAMANSGPDTNGSQFFIVTGREGTSLPPKYSLFGKVTEGLDVVKAIGAVPSLSSGRSDGVPTEAVVISSVTITGP